MKEEKQTRGEGKPIPVQSKRLIIIFTAVFVGIVLLFGIVLGTVSIIKSRRALISYKGVYIDEGVASYLAATAKYEFMSVVLAASGTEPYDDSLFWNDYPDGGENSYGELLASYVEEYVKRVAVGSYLFDKATGLTKDDKTKIRTAVREVLDLKANNDEDYFNELAEPMGFDYSDFEKAAELIYKYELAKTVIFGFDGASLASGGFAKECNDFLSTYTRVKLLFIRTEDGYVTDPETGKEELVDYDETKQAQVREHIDRISTLIENIRTDGDEQMSESAFDSFISEESEWDKMNVAGGYYLAPTSSHTSSLAKVYPEVVAEAYAMNIGEYREVTTKWGVCFIYKCELESGAYAKSTNEAFFSDFYTDASSYLYTRELEAAFDGVKVKDAFYDIDIETLPYNYIFTVNI